MATLLPEISLDPVGQVIAATKTAKGAYGFLLARGGDKSRIFWHSDFCVKEVPEIGDLVQFRLTPPRKPGECARAKDVLIIAKAEKEA